MCVQIAEELSALGIETVLTWVGDAPNSANTHDLLQSDKVHVEHLAWTEDWHLLADNDTVVLLASAYEGLGNTLVQAAAKGIPVVAGSNALGCADAVIQGVTGYLASTDSCDSYIDALLRARSLPAPGNLAGWFDRFSTQHTVVALQDVVDRAIKVGAN
jgi:glycosyltransferase involved in cell wall biosynthesis